MVYMYIFIFYLFFIYFTLDICPRELTYTFTNKILYNVTGTILRKDNARIPLDTLARLRMSPVGPTCQSYIY